MARFIDQGVVRCFPPLCDCRTEFQYGLGAARFRFFALENSAWLPGRSQEWQ
jgi:hypothetical protein